jgi:hypothetical protein
MRGSGNIAVRKNNFDPLDRSIEKPVFERATLARRSSESTTDCDARELRRNDASLVLSRPWRHSALPRRICVCSRLAERGKGRLRR